MTRLFEKFSESMPDWVRDYVLTLKLNGDVLQHKFGDTKTPGNRKEPLKKTTTFYEFLLEYGVDLSRVKFVEINHDKTSSDKTPKGSKDQILNCKTKLPIWHINNYFGDNGDLVYIGGDLSENDPLKMTYKWGLNGSELWLDSFYPDNFLEVTLELEGGLKGNKLKDKQLMVDNLVNRGVSMKNALRDKSAKVVQNNTTPKDTGLPFKAITPELLFYISDRFCYIDIGETYESDKYYLPDTDASGNIIRDSNGNIKYSPMKFNTYSNSRLKDLRNVIYHSLTDPVQVEIYDYLKDANGNVIKDTNGIGLKDYSKLLYSFTRPNNYFREKPGEYTGLTPSKERPGLFLTPMNKNGEYLDLDNLVDRSGYRINKDRFYRYFYNKLDHAGPIFKSVKDKILKLLDRTDSQILWNDIKLYIKLGYDNKDAERCNKKIEVYLLDTDSSNNKILTDIFLADFVSLQFKAIMTLGIEIDSMIDEMQNDEAILLKYASITMDDLNLIENNFKILYDAIDDGSNMVSLDPYRLIKLVSVNDKAIIKPTRKYTVDPAARRW